tara:strand:- start:615 stop:938 length:324 start_codon:yes stop_codon:yes gene_type:complete
MKKGKKSSVWDWSEIRVPVNKATAKGLGISKDVDDFRQSKKSDKKGQNLSVRRGSETEGFYCSICEQKFQSKAAHERNAHQLCKCDKCGKEFEGALSKNRHQRKCQA